MFKLRPYQQDASRIGVEHLRSYGKPFILTLATGAGKSLIIADMCRQLNEPVLILQPSKELLEQNYAKLRSYGIGKDEAKIYSASKGIKEIGRFTYATIGSIYKKPELFSHFKYVIIDECHFVNPKNLEGMYTIFLEKIGCKNVCGLTATPYRIGQKYYTDNHGNLIATAYLKMINRIKPFFWKNIVYKMETQELIDAGYLAPIQYFDADLDMGSLVVNTTGQEFTVKSLENFWNDSRLDLLAQNVMTVDKMCKRNLIFCSSIRQAHRAQQILASGNLFAEVVTAETPSREREKIVDDFKSGKTKHLLNVGVFTTGFDVPELDSIIIARPTMSLALWYQMVGRGVRIDPADPNKVLKVYDFAGCIDRHGRVETIKITKESDGFKDRVESENGVMTDFPLFSFNVKTREKVQRQLISKSFIKRV